MKYANIAKDKGLTSGVGDGKFAPDDLITSAQFSAILLRHSQSDTFDWTQSTNMLVDKGVITADQASNMSFFTRGDMAKIIYDAKQKGLL